MSKLELIVSIIVGLLFGASSMEAGLPVWLCAMSGAVAMMLVMVIVLLAPRKP